MTESRTRCASRGQIHISGHLPAVNRVWGGAGGPARAAVVEHDDVALTDQDIQQRWVPMIDDATQAEDERNTRLGTDGR